MLPPRGRCVCCSAIPRPSTDCGFCGGEKANYQPKRVSVTSFLVMKSNPNYWRVQQAESTGISPPAECCIATRTYGTSYASQPQLLQREGAGTFDRGSARRSAKSIHAVIELPKGAAAQAFTYAIERSCINKAEVVAADEREAGVRATLNLGHTFGHAIENVAGYGVPSQKYHLFSQHSLLTQYD